jgi:Na+-translocating ferredoxin:NAD+ oxidoreductase RNF subunit RnfB
VSSEEGVYRKLQKHLDHQPIGYAATESGADIRVLKHVFTPREAEIATSLDYKFETVEQISKRAKEKGILTDDLAQILDSMGKKGSIFYRERDGIIYYRNIPLGLGFYENQITKLTPEYVKDVSELMEDTDFGLSFLSTQISQMRTIPIEKSIVPEHHVASYDWVREIIQDLEGPIIIRNCICREIQAFKGEPCEKTNRLESCMYFRDFAKSDINIGVGREINKEEALEILSKAEEEGLVLQPSNNQEPEFICSCCGCCCGMLHNVVQVLPNPLDFWKSNYYGKVDQELCSGCRTCVDRCNVNAIKFRKSTNSSKINLRKCIGCGLCVTTCPEEAITLHKKEKEYVPPKTYEDMYETIKNLKKESN